MQTQGKLRIENFFRQYRIETYKKGHTLLLADESPKYAYYLIKGRVKQYDISQRGDEIIVNIFKPGTYFMVLTALTGQSNSYYFSAETDITLCRAPKDAISQFVTNNPDVMQHMLIQAHVGFESVLRRMTHLMRRDARGRIAFEILLDAEGFGETPHMRRYTLSINETELASRAGLSRETVSREVSRLKKRGLLAPTPKMTIVNLRQFKEELEKLL